MRWMLTAQTYDLAGSGQQAAVADFNLTEAITLQAKSRCWTTLVNAPETHTIYSHTMFNVGVYRFYTLKCKS